ncbi:MAG: serine hydrolase domain-containing protein [Candidatus Eisenbacteria bacterium]
MNTVRWTPLVALSIALAAGCSDDDKPTAPPAPSLLEAAVEQARVAHHLPAIAAASFSLDAIEVAASGVRRLGAPAMVTTDDLFHVGSLAKGMTATAIARLVDQGTLTWTLTLGEAFPDFAATMNPAYRDVTLEELLQNRSGLPGINDLEEFLALPEFAGNTPEQRHAFVGWLLSQPPAVERGTYLYSTGGFAVAAAIAEARSGHEWSSELRAELLNPLGVSMFVGWPLEAGPNEPCGHMIDGGALRAVDPSEGHIPLVVAPGGDVSMTIRDYARYAQLHLRALCGRPSLLSAASWDHLHAPVGDYAMGWSVIEAGGETVLTHTGSPATFYAFVVLYKNHRHGFVVLMNADTPEHDAAIADIIRAMAPTIGSAERSGTLATLALNPAAAD